MHCIIIFFSLFIPLLGCTQFYSADHGHYALTIKRGPHITKFYISSQQKTVFLLRMNSLQNCSNDEIILGLQKDTWYSSQPITEKKHVCNNILKTFTQELDPATGFKLN